MKIDDILSEYLNGLLEIKLEDDYEITGVLHTINDNLSDTVQSDKEYILYGKRDIFECINGLKFNISPYSFFQINTKTAQLLYNKAIELIDCDNKEIAFDLFSGTGTIGQILANEYKKVYSIEIVREAVDKAIENAKLNNLDNIVYLCGDVFEKLKEIQDIPNVVVIDPPRPGIGKKTIERLIEYNIDSYLYISCNPISLVEDIKVFQNMGYYVKKVRIVDMFPFTNHVETVALLSKLDVDKHIDVVNELDELDLTSAESKATYAQIKEYVWNKFELKVSTLYIAQIKKKCGIELREHYNKSKKEKQIIPQCTPEKEEAIMDALRHFKMI